MGTIFGVKSIPTNGPGARLGDKFLQPPNFKNITITELEVRVLF
jgi:hypothetical protein